MEELQGWGGESQLCWSFLHTSQDLIIDNKHHSDTFWEQMALHHNQLKPNGHVEGSTQSLEMKWSLIKHHDISKFVGVYGNIASLNESRSSTEYILHNAFQLYKLKHLKCLGFCFLHCWFLSKDVFKWKDLCENLQKATPMT